MKKLLALFIFATANLVAENLLRIELQGNGFVDETVVYFDPGSSDNFVNTEDAVKLFSSAPGVPSIYTIENSQCLSINVKNELNADKIVALGIKSQAATSYSITAADFDSFEPSSNIFLQDVQEGLLIDLKSSNSYQFNLPVGDIQNRFNLLFNPAVKLYSTVLDCANQGTIEIEYPSNHLANIVLKDENNVTVTSLTGFNGFTTIGPVASGNYIANILTIGGTDVDYVTVSLGYSVDVYLNASSTFVPAGDPVIIYASVVNGTNHNWDFGDGTTISSTPLVNFVYTYNTPGTYTVKLNSSNGICTDEDSISIEVVNTTGFLASNKPGHVEMFLGRQSVLLSFAGASSARGDVKIYDMAGRLVKIIRDVPFTGSYSIDLSDVATGNYIITIGDELTRMIFTTN
jgi:hypothetical protein